MIRCVSHSSSSRFLVTNPAFISLWICVSKDSCFFSSVVISSGVSGKLGLVEVIGGTYLQNGMWRELSLYLVFAELFAQHTSIGGKFSAQFSTISFVLASSACSCRHETTTTQTIIECNKLQCTTRRNFSTDYKTTKHTRDSKAELLLRWSWIWIVTRVGMKLNLCRYFEMMKIARSWMDVSDLFSCELASLTSQVNSKRVWEKTVKFSNCLNIIVIHALNVKVERETVSV